MVIRATALARKHPRRPNTPIFVSCANHADAAVSGKPDRGRGLNYSVVTSQVCVLRPLTRAPRKHCYRADTPMIGNPCKCGNVAIF
jgi:hypothetical protein